MIKSIIDNGHNLDLKITISRIYSYKTVNYENCQHTIYLFWNYVKKTFSQYRKCEYMLGKLKKCKKIRKPKYGNIVSENIRYTTIKKC